MQNNVPFHGRIRVKAGFTHTTLAPFRSSFDVALLSGLALLAFPFLVHYPIAIKFTDSVILSLFLIPMLGFIGFYLMWMCVAYLFLSFPSFRLLWAVGLLSAGCAFVHYFTKIANFLVAPFISKNVQFETTLFTLTQLGFVVPIIIMFWYLFKTKPLKKVI